jgi:hypothetical protein
MIICSFFLVQMYLHQAGKDIENGKGISFTKRAVDAQSQGTLARPGQGGRVNRFAPRGFSRKAALPPSPGYGGQVAPRGGQVSNFQFEDAFGGGPKDTGETPVPPWEPVEAGTPNIELPI